MHHSLSTLRRPAPKSICERQSQHQPPLERATTSSLLRRTCDLPTRPPERFQVRRSTQVAATSAGAGERPLPAAVHPHWTCHPIHCGPPKSPHIGWVAQISTHRMGRPNLHTPNGSPKSPHKSAATVACNPHSALAGRLQMERHRHTLAPMDHQ